MPSRFLRTKSATVAGQAVLSIGGVAAAATGLVPAAERAATQASSTPGATVEGAHARGAAVTATLPDEPGATAATKAPPAGLAAGPEASGPAEQGLCQAWLAGQGDVQAPAVVVGGAGQMAAYCRSDSDASAEREQRPAAPPTTGQPEDPGQGHGMGGPPTTS